MCPRRITPFSRRTLFLWKIAISSQLFLWKIAIFSELFLWKISFLHSLHLKYKQLRYTIGYACPKTQRHEKPMVVHARKAPHGSHSLLIRKFRIVQPHRQRRRRYRPPCQRHPPLCRFANNKNHDLRSSVNHAHGFYAVQLSFSIKSMYSCHSKSKPRNQKKITLKRDKHKPHHPPCWRIAQEPIPISPDNN